MRLLFPISDLSIFSMFCSISPPEVHLLNLLKLLYMQHCTSRIYELLAASEIQNTMLEVKIYVLNAFSYLLLQQG